MFQPQSRQRVKRQEPDRRIWFFLFNHMATHLEICLLIAQLFWCCTKRSRKSTLSFRNLLSPLTLSSTMTITKSRHSPRVHQGLHCLPPHAGDLITKPTLETRPSFPIRATSVLSSLIQWGYSYLSWVSWFINCYVNEKPGGFLLENASFYATWPSF